MQDGFGKEVEGTVNVDPAKLEVFMGKMIGHMTGRPLCYSIWLGDELGLYRELAGTGPRNADSVAAKTGLQRPAGAGVARRPGGRRAGRLRRRPRTPTSLGPEAAMALADDGSPVFVARGDERRSASMFLDVQKVAAAFRGDGALAWGEHHPCLFCGTEWFFRTGYRAHLTTQWIPALDGVETKLRAGARVADVGCGHGASVVAMAAAYPELDVLRVRLPRPVDRDGRRAGRPRRGWAGGPGFQVATATGYAGRFDLICFFDCLHDMGDPVGAARHAREHLAPGGTVLLVEPFALDGRAAEHRREPDGGPVVRGVVVRSARPTRCRRRWGWPSAPRPARPGCGRSSRRPGSRHFRRAAQTPMNLIIEARA